MENKKQQRPSNARRGTGKNGNGNPDKIKGQGFHTNPERINRKGRPKLIRHLNDRLKEMGYEPLSEGQLADCYKNLLQLSEEDLKKIGGDKNEPYFIRRVAHYLASNQGMEMLDRIIDRSYGRAKQFVESSVTTVNIESASKEEQGILTDVMNKVSEIDKAADPEK